MYQPRGRLTTIRAGDAKEAVFELFGTTIERRNGSLVRIEGMRLRATGRSPQAFRSVSVVASSGLDADALSTAAFVLGLPKGLRLIDQWPGADALFVLKDGSVQATAGFPGSLLRG